MANASNGVNAAVMVANKKTLFGGDLSEPVAFPQTCVGGKTFAILSTRCKDLKHFLGLHSKGKSKLGLLLQLMRNKISEASAEKASELKLLSGGFTGAGRRRFRADNKAHIAGIPKMPHDVDVTLEEGGPLDLQEQWTFTAMFNVRKTDAPTMLFDINHWEQLFKLARVGTFIGGQHFKLRKGRPATDPLKIPTVAEHRMRLQHGKAMYRARVYGRSGTAMMRVRRLCATPSEGKQAPLRDTFRRNREDVYSKDRDHLTRDSRSISNWWEHKREEKVKKGGSPRTSATTRKRKRSSDSALSPSRTRSERSCASAPSPSPTPSDTF